MKNILLEESYTKCGGESSNRTFSKNSKLSMSLDQQSEFSYSLISLYAQVEDYQNLKKIVWN